MQVDPLLLRAQLALCDGLGVGVEHDADGSAFVGGSSGWHTRGGSGEELGQQQIFLAQGLVGDDSYFAIAWGGHEGDDTMALEEAQDAPARPLHEVDCAARSQADRAATEPVLSFA